MVKSNIFCYTKHRKIQTNKNKNKTKQKKKKKKKASKHNHKQTNKRNVSFGVNSLIYSL